jgi:hypothetical protein
LLEEAQEVLEAPSALLGFAGRGERTGGGAPPRRGVI